MEKNLRSYGTNYEKKAGKNTLLDTFFQIKFQVKFVCIVIANTIVEKNQKSIFLRGPQTPSEGIFKKQVSGKSC